MSKINEIKTKIENTDYWDARIFDCQFLYFGDEVQIIFEGEGDTAYSLNFLNCYKVTYQNDYTLDSNLMVQNMNKGQLGYFMQDIDIEEYMENKQFIEFSLNLSIMTMKIICKNITIKKINTNDITFFGQNK